MHGSPTSAIVDLLLEKEPDRRYPSATVLAEDIRRALSGEPLLLRPPGRIELARRFVAGHRIGVALATAAALIDALDLVARSCDSLDDSQGAVVARRAALRLAGEAKPLDDVLIDEAAFYLAATLAESADPGDLVEARTLLERTRARLIESDQGGHLLAELVEGIRANVAEANGDVVKAEQLFRTSLSIKRHLRCRS
ncbi:MAG: hypothetical protein SGJ11_04330 [Phycisphaerae bacterium]|nr:hypothetical protein [Phycisphaerae bacterium]